MLGFRFYVRSDLLTPEGGGPRGPYALDTLARFVQRGKIEPDALVSVDRRTWWPAREMPELFREARRDPAPEWVRAKRRRRTAQVVAASATVLLGVAAAGLKFYNRVQRFEDSQQTSREFDHLRETSSRLAETMRKSRQDSAELQAGRKAREEATPSGQLRARYPELTRLFGSYVMPGWEDEFPSVMEAVDAYRSTVGETAGRRARQEIERLLDELPGEGPLREALLLRLGCGYDPGKSEGSSCRAWLEAVAQRLP